MASTPNESRTTSSPKAVSTPGWDTPMHLAWKRISMGTDGGFLPSSTVFPTVQRIADSTRSTLTRFRMSPVLFDEPTPCCAPARDQRTISRSAPGNVPRMTSAPYPLDRRELPSPPDPDVDAEDADAPSSSDQPPALALLRVAFKWDKDNKGGIVLTSHRSSSDVADDAEATEGAE